MEIIEVDLNNSPSLDSIAACIGYFDGMHVGHQKLIQKTLKQAKAYGLKSACITFHPDPWAVLKNIKDIPHISSMDERIEIGKSFELDYWIIIPFTNQLSKMTTFAFETMLSQLNVKQLICGFDFSYGYKGEGNINTLKQQNYFDVIEIQEVTYENEKISSSRIEKCIESGDMELTYHLLGRYYSIKGSIVNGNHLGNTIGFPTANIKCKYLSILPQKGVYVGFISIDNKRYSCMMNIGHNPTFNYCETISIEAYILDFHEDIYGKEIELFFVKKIRNEKKFSSKEELIQQLKIDLLEVKKI